MSYDKLYEYEYLKRIIWKLIISKCEVVEFVCMKYCRVCGHLE